MQIVCIIPARYNSKRLPGKPLIEISGKPLIQWVFENARQIPSIEKIIIATDNKKIKKIVENFGGEIIITSPYHISGTDRVKEAADKMNLTDKDIVLNIQGDEPFIDAKSVERLIELFKKDSSIQVGTLAFLSENQEELRNPNVVKVVIDKNNFSLYFSRSPIPYSERKKGIKFLKHLGIYIFRYSFLKKWDSLPHSNLEEIEKLEQLRILENGYKIKVLLSFKDSIGVDTEDDLKAMEKEIEKSST